MRAAKADSQAPLDLAPGKTCQEPSAGGDKAQPPEKTISPEHAAALRERKLDPELCKQLGVYSKGNAIAFQYFQANGDLHNTKIRRGKGNMPFEPSGKPLILYGLEAFAGDVNPDEAAIITEGEFDRIASHQVGYTRVGSVPNGAQSGEDKGFDFLYQPNSRDLIPELAKFSQFIIATDGDEKGIACRDALAVRLGDERCSYVEYPPGCKDLNDILKHHGPAAVCEAIENARPMWVDEICGIDDVPDPGPEVRYRLGWPELDHHGFRITLPAFWPIIGPYGSGKSVLLRQIMCSLYEMHGWRCLLTSFEEKIKPRYHRDLRRHIIGRAPIPDKPWTKEETDRADEIIRNCFWFLRRKRGTRLDPDRLLDRIEYAVVRYGIKIVGVDPFNKVSVRGQKGATKSDAIGDFITRLKDLADDYGLLVIVLAHPPKQGVEKRLAKTGLLTLNDGEDSRHWGNDADIGWCVWRDIDGPTMIHIDKLKDHETMGRPTLIETKFSKAMNQFSVQRMGYEILAQQAMESG